MERAESVMDKKEKKVERSAKKGKAVKERSVCFLRDLGLRRLIYCQAAWDELNGKVHDRRMTPRPKEKDEDDWEDEEMEVNGEVDSSIAETPAISSSGHLRHPPNPPDSEDEIL